MFVNVPEFLGSDVVFCQSVDRIHHRRAPLMNKTITATIAAATLVLAACGSSSSGGGDDQSQVADELMKLAEDQGFELDRDCVEDNAGDLSDDDAQKIVDAGVDGDVELSEEGDAVGDRIFTECVDAASYIESFVNEFAEGDDSIDAECMKQELEGLSVDEATGKIIDAALACSSDG